MSEIQSRTSLDFTRKLKTRISKREFELDLRLDEIRNGKPPRVPFNSPQGYDEAQPTEPAEPEDLVSSLEKS